MFHPSYRPNVDVTAHMAASHAEARAREVKTDIEIIRCDIERLLMITEAMWQIMKERFGYQDEELANRVVEIDRRDGKLDGRVAPGPPPACPNCGRTLERKRAVCLYCGQLIARDPFER